MKKKLAIMVSAALVALSLGACAGTPAEDAVEATNALNIPPLQPVNHLARWDMGGSDYCYNCHGATDEANPAYAHATAIPEFHYASGYDSQEIAGTYQICITCHPVGDAPVKANL